MGLDTDFELRALPHEGLRTRLQALLRELQLTGDPQQKLRVQREIDAHLYAVALMCTRSPLAQQIPAALLRMPALSWLPTYDMGAVIREIVIEPHNNAKTVMAKILQYCLPYIKHNRLNFPDLHTLAHAELVAMVQIIAATCMGAYSHAQRKCTWNIRVGMFWLFWSLLHTSNAQDMFLFCRTHMSLLRLCIIEYFIFFMREYMPTELLFMDRIMGLTAGAQHVFRQFTLIVDSFRQMALQDKTLDLAAINAKAQTCIDKCNRLCKGKSKSVCKTYPATQHRYATSTAVRSMHLPRMPSALHVQCYDDRISPLEAQQVVAFQQHIHTHPLPHNMQRMQARAIVEQAQHNTLTAYQSSFLYYCLQCQIHNPSLIAAAKMRVGPCHVACAGCNSHQAVIRIQTVGRLVSIFDNVFYYCVQCMQVHAWQSGVSDIDSCPRASPADVRRHHHTVCIVCQRNTNAPPLYVLDDELGVMQCLLLCPNHRPPAFEQHIVHNLDAICFYLSSEHRRVLRGP